ncbi:hypothetical protein AAG747_03100 [Rapidithrix thailandica]|uniref:ABC transporter ATPase n=1 Tax=Rapidithrix thailandica TaxID=413964 RepID=A0AAW9S7H6_9BACT
MLANIEDLSGQSRVWIYQSSRQLNEEEVQTVQSTIESFIQAWDAHGAPLKGAVQVQYQQFIVLAVDEAYNAASGCSIDKSVAVIRDLEQRLQISLLDRSQVAFLNEQEEVFVLHFSKLKEAVTQGVINEESLLLNNSDQSLETFRQGWKVKAGESWLSRYFKKASV